MDGSLPAPSAEEHRRVLVLVRPLLSGRVGGASTAVFNRVLERLHRYSTLLVSESPRRVLHVHFVSSVNGELAKFGEFQTHRRIFGVIGVACSSNSAVIEESQEEPSSTAHRDAETNLETDEPSGRSGRRLRSRSESLSTTVSHLEEFHAAYKTLKLEHAGALVDSRCITIGFDDLGVRRVFSSRETLSFRSLDEMEPLQQGIRELLRAIFTVLESRRVEGTISSGKAASATSSDTLPVCPTLVDEEKFRYGVESASGKNYRRKCAGRLRKQVADLCLLTGLPLQAMQEYAAAAETLKGAGDALWLAGAFEGWACAAMCAHFFPLDASGAFVGGSDREKNGLIAAQGSMMHRVASMTEEQFRASGGAAAPQGLPHPPPPANGSASKTLTVPSTNGASSNHNRGHYRVHSDENAGRLAVAMTSSAPSSETIPRRSSRLPWIRRDRSGGEINCDEVLERFEQSLENYAKFSFSARVEYECMMKAVGLLRCVRRYIPMEQFHREHVGKYLDDSFDRFDHTMKATICAHAAATFKMIGFRRKYAFFARLGVLFRLHQDETPPKSAADFRAVYPALYRTLAGYGISERETAGATPGLCASHGPLQLQIRTLHEVFTAAQRAGYVEAAIRHCCYLLQSYYDHMEPAMVNRLLADLDGLVRQRTDTVVAAHRAENTDLSVPRKRSSRSPPPLHHLGQLLSLECGGIILPPVQMTRFPTISEPQLCRLPAHLAPVVLPPANAAAAASIFIYSPFQLKADNAATSWVVDCVGSLSLSVYNCRKEELIVHELMLLSDGCAFEGVPVRLALPPATTTPAGAVGPSEGASAKHKAPHRPPPPQEKAHSTRIRLLGVPRSPGMLTITGYSCVVFGVRNVCRLLDHATGLPLTVRVLPALPQLRFETTLPRAPVCAPSSVESEADTSVEEEQITVAELQVYSGQTFEHVLCVENSSTYIGIRNVRLAVQQPKVTGGPSLVDVLGMDDEASNPEAESACEPSTSKGGGAEAFSLAPCQKRRIRLRIFGIDPTAAAEDADSGGLATDDRESMIARSISGYSTSAGGVGGGAEHHASSDSASVYLAHDDQSGQHDLIPYTGRLLVAEFVFHYEADLEGDDGERYERCGRVRLLIHIVPAITVASWLVVPGDGPFTRYIVVDVSNASDADAELVYSGNRVIAVQARETCRVPLLSACCCEVGGRAFHSAAQCDSLLMQRQEVERLRRILEKHVASHLDIRWSIPSMRLDGRVPVGALLSSVALLKQLVLPALSLAITVSTSRQERHSSRGAVRSASNSSVTSGATVVVSADDEVSVALGELVSIRLDVVSSLDYDLAGHLSLECYQEVGGAGRQPLDRSSALLIAGHRAVPFVVGKKTAPSSASPPEVGFSASFSFLFRAEGVYKVKPVATADPPHPPHLPDEVYVSPLTFNVTTKAVH